MKTTYKTVANKTVGTEKPIRHVGKFAFGQKRVPSGTGQHVAKNPLMQSPEK